MSKVKYRMCIDLFHNVLDANLSSNENCKMCVTSDLCPYIFFIYFPYHKHIKALENVYKYPETHVTYMFYVFKFISLSFIKHCFPDFVLLEKL